jgi:benzoyl-CoA reductase/2-hydroxyglutaryl-CoA dehydratase subunit BcrC/BadD/HgdB
LRDIELLGNFSNFIRKKKVQGIKIIAYIAHENIPEELIDAAGLFPLQMIFAGDDELMNASHDYLPPSTCAFAQSCIGFFTVKPHEFEFLGLIDYFIISNHCVSDICASEVISKFFNIPQLRFYTSYIKNETSLRYLKLELEDFIRQLEQITHIKIENKNIIASIKKYDNFKQKVRILNNLSINSFDKLRMLQKARLFGPDMIEEIDNYITNAQTIHPIANSSTKDIILTGCSLFIDDYLIDMLEEAGINIIHFDTWIGENYLTEQTESIDLEGIKDPLDVFIKRFEAENESDHSVPNFLDTKISTVEQIYKKHEQETGKKPGVINNIIKFCDHFSIMAAHFKTRLQEKGIQVLNLERDYSRAARGQISTRIEAFLEMINR